MKVRVLFFARLRELMHDAPECLIKLSQSECSVTDLLERLQAEAPQLKGALAGVRVAVNEAFVERDQCLQEGDVVALIPPVAGG